MWQTSADIESLKKRAEVLRCIRQYFYDKHVMEIDVPIIGASTVTDPYLDSISLSLNKNTHYLQTSPEYFMKRALCAGVGDIFYLGKAFRQDELGRRHSPEFTMLEWYRHDFDDLQLAQELIDIVSLLSPGISIHKYRYADIFEQLVGIDPRIATSKALEIIAKNKCTIEWTNEPKETWLDFLFTHLVEPQLQDGLYVIFDYPKEQAALARVEKDEDDMFVAKRFEVFINGMELANGYWELSDKTEQLKRFEKNQKTRELLSKKPVDIDKKFMASLEQGLPDCSGVAMGIDRLLMCLLNKNHIDDVNAFGFQYL